MNVVIGLALAILYIYPTWRICQKAGYPGWLGVFIVIPLANLALLYFLALGQWPSMAAVGTYERLERREPDQG